MCDNTILTIFGILLTIIIIIAIVVNINDAKLHVYGIGIFKSGTSSLACIFKNYKSVHEYDKSKIFSLIKENNEAQIINYLIEKRNTTLFEVDSSGFNIFIIPHLLTLYTDCKFILTVRNVIDHFDSIISYVNAGNGLGTATYVLGEPNSNIPEKEKIVTKHYKIYWPLKIIVELIVKMYCAIIKMISNDRLLVINITDGTDYIHKIASFLNIPSSSLQKCHINKSNNYLKASSLLDTLYIKEILNGLENELLGFF
jgi:hypothetical protein